MGNTNEVRVGTPELLQCADSQGPAGSSVTEQCSKPAHVLDNRVLWDTAPQLSLLG